MRAFVVLCPVLVTLAACGTDIREEPDPVEHTTWFQHVAPVLTEHCTGCHREGGIGPFDLTDYDTGVENAGRVLDAIETGIMPPWSATETEDCTPTRAWKHDPRLSEDEIALVRDWIDDGTPEGSIVDLPEPPDTGLPNKSHTLTPTVPFISTGTTDQFICYVLDPQVTELRFLEGWNVRPSNPAVVHHAIVLTLGADLLTAAKNANAVGTPLPCSAVPMTEALGAWAPGQGAAELPPGVGMEVLPGTGILVQLHYHPGGRIDNAPDATSIDLRLSAAQPERRYFLGGWGNASAAPTLQPGPNDTTGVEFRIPANTANHTETMRFTIDIPDDPTRRISMFMMQPHQHYVGTKVDLKIHRATPPPGEAVDECLVHSDWNFDWQRTYQYDTTVDQLPTFGHGDTVELKCTYDNTMHNPFVQRALMEQGLVAPIDVTLGEQTLNEMCLALVGTIL